MKPGVECRFKIHVLHPRTTKIYGDFHLKKPKRRVSSPCIPVQRWTVVRRAHTQSLVCSEQSYSLKCTHTHTHTHTLTLRRPAVLTTPVRLNTVIHTHIRTLQWPLQQTIAMRKIQRVALYQKYNCGM